MPELPEVETVLRGLEPAMLGRLILRADIRRKNLRWEFPKDMAKRLIGARVLRLHRRSKYILCDLDTKETLLIHLGMSGQIIIFPPRDEHPELGKHNHVVLDLDDGTRIIFNDPRRFGAMDLLDTKTAEQHRLLVNIGPEPLGNHFNPDYLIQKIYCKNTPIKTALLDQKIIAGLGNIYVCEVLWRAGVSPLHKCKDLSQSQITKLVPIIRDVLTEAIIAGGSSLKDYRKTNGDLGYFQHSFAVYGRENLPCTKKGCSHHIKRIIQSGRSSFYCENCQK